MTYGLIVDGIHVDPLSVKAAFSAKGADGIALLDGVAFIARSAAKKRAKLSPPGKVVVHPVAIKYFYRGDVPRVCDEVLTDIEFYELRYSGKPAAFRLSLTNQAADSYYSGIKNDYFSAYGGYSPDPVTFLTAVAARTRRIRVTTGAVVSSPESGGCSPCVSGANTTTEIGSRVLPPVSEKPKIFGSTSPQNCSRGLTLL